MSYEVRKRIKGHDYLYRVETLREAHGGKPKQKWIYLGRLEGNRLLTTRTRRGSDAKTRIVDALLALVEKRDVSHLTVDVIAHAAGISRPTFYRCFPDRMGALRMATLAVVDEVVA